MAIPRSVFSRIMTLMDAAPPPLANGDRYDGDFKKGVYEGLGVFTFSDGDQLKGRFRNNLFVGNSSDLRG